MKKVSWKISIFLALLILITLLNCSSDNKSENNTTIITPPTSKTDLPQNYYMPEIPRISVHEVKAKLDSGANIVIVDVRYPEYYDKSHISGAISLPEPGMKGPYTMLNGYNEIYTYCTWEDENQSARAVSRFIQEGFKNSFAIEGGFTAWQDAGYPIEKGPESQ